MKCIVYLAFVLALLGVVLASVSQPVSLLSRATDPQPITPLVTLHSIDSDTIAINAAIDINLFAKKWSLELVLDFEGVEISQADYICTTSRATEGTNVSSAFRGTAKVSKNQIKVENFQFPPDDRATRRYFQMMLKVSNVAATGFKIKPTSVVSADQGKIKQTFADVASTIAPSFAKLVPKFEIRKQKKTTDPLRAPIDFTLNDLNIPEGTITQQALILTDLLSNVRFVGTGERIICHADDQEVEGLVTIQALSFRDLKPFSGIKSVRVVCPETVEMEFVSTNDNHIWNFAYPDEQNQKHIAQAADVHMLKPKKNPSFIFRVAVVVIIAVLVIAAIIFGLKTAQVGPFKPKEELESSLINSEVDDSSYRAF